jgi:hypothetical protein
MASPMFAQSAVMGRVSFSVANVATDGSGTLQALTWVGTAGASTPPATSWVLKQLWIQETSAAGTADLADCLVQVYTTDSAGSSPMLLDTIDLGNPAATSTTTGPAGSAVDGPVKIREYFGIIFPPGVDLKITMTVAATSGNATIHVFGEMT